MSRDLPLLLVCLFFSSSSFSFGLAAGIHAYSFRKKKWQKKKKKTMKQFFFFRVIKGEY
jgi:hypothetical protein